MAPLSHDATVNDVLLALVAGGLRALLRSRGEPDDDVVRVYVPVTPRAADQRGSARGNLISQLVVPLPLGVPDPGAPLDRIAAETAHRKARPRPSLGVMFAHRLAGGLMLAMMRRNPVKVETADVPGPAQSMYFAGARVLEAFPLLDLIGNVPLGSGAPSYAGPIGVMAVAYRHALPDLAGRGGRLAGNRRSGRPALRQAGQRADGARCAPVHETGGIEPYERESVAALSFLAGQRAVDPARLAVLGQAATITGDSTLSELSQIDRYDPAALVGELPKQTALLLTCSNADDKFGCDEGAPSGSRLIAGIGKARSRAPGRSRPLPRGGPQP